MKNRIKEVEKNEQNFNVPWYNSKQSKTWIIEVLNREGKTGNT